MVRKEPQPLSPARRRPKTGGQWSVAFADSTSHLVVYHVPAFPFLVSSDALGTSFADDTVSFEDMIAAHSSSGSGGESSPLKESSRRIRNEAVAVLVPPQGPSRGKRELRDLEVASNTSYVL